MNRTRQVDLGTPASNSQETVQVEIDGSVALLDLGAGKTSSRNVQKNKAKSPKRIRSIVRPVRLQPSPLARHQIASVLSVFSNMS